MSCKLVRYIVCTIFQLLETIKKISKVRIVYDASLKIRNSPSLNSCSLPDPSLTESLFGVLIWFHLKKICIFCRYCKGIPASYIG